MDKPEGSPKDDDDQSEVELEGVDMEGVDEEDDGYGNHDAEMDGAVTNDADAKSDENDTEALQAEDAEELEAAKRERMELLAAEKRKAAGGHLEAAKALDPRDRFEFLIAQSDVFAHFLAGSVAATGKKGKKGSRGKKGRMTEAEEDAQLLKTLESKRRTVRLEKQPGLLAPTCSMHKYQLEGLNWMIKLHDSGINGILADEVRLSIGLNLRLRMQSTYLFIHSPLLSLGAQ
jgi:SWI/SNF-related matrix-associated actin-dependent regulator of chromatin subfamily A member 5